MRRTVIAGLALALSLAALTASCSGEPRVRLGLVMNTPQGLLDEATTVTLTISQGSGCDAETGHVGNPEGAQTFTMEKTGCASGIAWCKTIEIDRDGETKTFGVVAKSAAGTLAEGCTAAPVDQDPLEITITMQRFIAPKCCNDGALQAGEQCDTGVPSEMTCSGEAGGECRGIDGDDVCECDCTAKEILLSNSTGTEPFLTNGAAGTKTSLAMTFAPGIPQIDQALRAVFVNTDGLARGGSDIHERVLKPDLKAYTTDLVPLAGQFRLPAECAGVQTSDGIVEHQESPAIATVGTTTAIVYMSDENQGGNFDVFLEPHTVDGCNDTRVCASAAECQTGNCAGNCAVSQQVSLSGPAPGAKDPAIAGGPADAALVVWTNGTQVEGRIWRTDGTLLPSSGTILLAQSGSGAKVAGSARGWRVVYQGGGTGDADGIFMKDVDAKGSVGAEARVNDATSGPQDQPDIAMLTDGRSIVVWRSAGDIFFQRFDAKGIAIDRKDQESALNTRREGTQQNPAVAASRGFGDFYAVAWESLETAQIAARFVGARSGFGYNSVSGQNDEFSATSPSVVGERQRPAIAIGGGGFVAIGWEDRSLEHPGVYVRRFPIPAGI